MNYENFPLINYFNFLQSKGLVTEYMMPNGKQSLEIKFNMLNELKPFTQKQEPDNITRTRLVSMGFIESNNRRYILWNGHLYDINYITYQSAILPQLSYSSNESHAAGHAQSILSKFGTTSPIGSLRINPTTEYYESIRNTSLADSYNVRPQTHRRGRDSRRQPPESPPQHSVPSTSSYNNSPPPYEAPPPYGGSPPSYGSPSPYEAPPAYESITQDPTMGFRGDIAGPSHLSQAGPRGSVQPPRFQRGGGKRGRR
ncbi:hypothetical protein [Xenorhabdus koppenhoeferi]|uniref:Uncharacterized protein n=1 Tax=Xenorhabdus koppenhoeferi TaxID=351659 RepID=A0A1I7KCU9_9GAMM|nr:hypothetical protein [Xenorhabdus koppenhoeferi]SFU95253.1 hypothetical protein SAMN05421784_1553 [Xenorhabdus koppenhoeferi]